MPILHHPFNIETFNGDMRRFVFHYLINNIINVINLCKEFKLKFPNKNIWLWTGYEFENIPNKNIIDVTDYIIDGLFIESLKDRHLKYRGSNNQRIFKNGKLILDNEIDI